MDTGKDKMVICNTVEEWEAVLKAIGNPENLGPFGRKGACIHVGKGHCYYGLWCNNRKDHPATEAITAKEFLNIPIMDDYSLTF